MEHQSFELQGHRGARGLKPENTFPSFEVAFDLGVTSVETDLHLTLDDVPIVCHDPIISTKLFRNRTPNTLLELGGRLIRRLPLAELRTLLADRNPDSERFSQQDDGITPLAREFAESRSIHPYTPPTLGDLFDFAAEYCGPMGERVGKTREQRERISRMTFDLELKRVPFNSEYLDDNFDGTTPRTFERVVVEAIQRAGIRDRVIVRSFDHRCLLAIHHLEPTLTSAVLIANTAPIDPVSIVRAAGASIYCPEFTFLDREQVDRCRRQNVRVLPWTVNEIEDMQRLLDWGVDGITTDFPDRLAEVLRNRQPAQAFIASRAKQSPTGA